MEPDCLKKNLDTASSCPSGEEMITDSMGDLLSSSTCGSSFTSLTAVDLFDLDLMSTENESQNKTNFKHKDNKSRQSSAFNFDMCAHDWYLHPMFNRFWRHYGHAISWQRNHQSFIQNDQNRCRENRMYLQQYQRHFHPKHKTSHSTSPRKKAKNIPTKRHLVQEERKQDDRDRKSHDQCNSESHDHCNSKAHDDCKTDVSDVDSEVYEMEITDEMVEFFAKSQKHRKERDEDKNGPSDKKGDLKDIGQASKKIPTSEAPKERPGLRRTVEMTQIYGKGAAMIHGMETALQMTYDRSVDIKQPVCWPYMPLKIVFE